VDVGFNVLLQFFKRIVSTQIIHLAFQCTPKGLHRSVVNASTDTGHARGNVSGFKYVGRATPRSGLGERVYNQINAFGGKNGWDTVITDENVKCGLVIFTNNEDWHWLASLEILLIDNLRPKFNYRT
jgi:hypothetical protein